MVEQRLWSVAVEKYGVVAPDPEDKVGIYNPGADWRWGRGVLGSAPPPLVHDVDF